MQSTCLVSVRVTTHSLKSSYMSEHRQSMDLTACAVVEGLRRAPASREREEEYRREQEHDDGGQADAGEREWFAFSHFECFLPCLVASVFHARMASLRSSWRVRMRMPWRSQEHAHICRMADVFRLTAQAIRSKLMFRLPQVGHGTGLCHLRGRVSFGWPIVFQSFP